MARRKKRKRKDKPQRPSAGCGASGAARAAWLTPKPLPAAPNGPAARRLTAALVELEIARGHDGLLRGKPEPVLLVGAYLAGAGPIRLLGRSLSRLMPTLPFPSTIKINAEKALLFDKHFRSSPDARLLLMAIALEEDAGTDVTRLYAVLEHPPRLRIWPSDACMPIPRTLDEIAQDPSCDPHAARVHVLEQDVDTRDSCNNDKFVGACLLALSSGGRVDDCWRLHFLADNGLNDWTATVRILLE